MNKKVLLLAGLVFFLMSLFFSVYTFSRYTTRVNIQSTTMYTASWNFEVNDESEYISNALNEIGIVKNEQIPLENYYSVNFSEDEFKVIFNSYDKALKRKRLIDFDDMMAFISHSKETWINSVDEQGNVRENCLRYFLENDSQLANEFYYNYNS